MDIRYTTTESSRTLGFFANTRGIGYTYFENGNHFYSAMITARKRDNDTYMKRVERVIFELRPQLVVIEEYQSTKGGIKKGRTRDLIQRIEKYVKKESIEVALYTRRQVRDVFSLYDVSTKYDIALLLCNWIPWLESCMYVPRKGEQMEPYSSAIFDAVSLVLTHGYLEG